MRMVVTTSIPHTEAFQAPPFLAVHDLSGILAQVINRTVSSLFYGGSPPEAAK